MILAIDIGNTNTVLGCWQGDSLLFTLRIRSDRHKTADEYGLLLDGLLNRQGVDPRALEGGILSSVVPELRTVMAQAAEALTGKKFLVVGSGIKTGLDIRIDDPSKLGADLVVDAVAALAEYAPPLAIFDMGTATTLSVVGRSGTYLGGMIIPGLRVSVDALSARAAQLPYIHLGPPEKVIGGNTVECMQAGAIYGSAAMVDGLIDRVEEALGEKVTAIATGGLMTIVHPYCKREVHYEPDLLLKGLGILYKKNCR